MASNHLDEIEDGAGCTEIWEHLSENRDDDTDDESESESEGL